MRATVDAKEFSQALNRVIKVIKKSTIQELDGVLVQVKDGRCTLTATDFNTWLTATIPTEGDDLGFVFQRPKDAAKACGHFEGRLVLETEEKENGKDRWTQLTMFCGARAAEIRTFQQEDYPVIPEQQARYTYTVNAARLLERVNHVKYTLLKPNVSEKAHRTHVQFDGSKVFALDGCRLAWDVDDSLSVHQPFMVLPGGLEYLKFFDDHEVVFSTGERYLQITDGMTTILTRIEGPDVFAMDRAVPKESLEEFYIFPKDALQELDYLKKLSSDSTRPCIYSTGGKLMLRTAGGQYSTKIQTEGDSSIDFAFALSHMIGALQQFRGESRVKVKVNSSLAPIVLEAEGRSDSALIMPLRFKPVSKAA